MSKINYLRQLVSNSGAKALGRNRFFSFEMQVDTLGQSPQDAAARAARLEELGRSKAPAVPSR